MNKKGWLVTSLSFILAFALGDAIMWGVASAVKQLTSSIVVRWSIAIVVIWLGSFLLFGCTQVWAWRKKGQSEIPDEDLRMKWALRGFQSGGIIGHLAGCFAAGPIAMGFYTGQKNDPRAYVKTLWASLIFAALWGPWYVQLGRTGFLLVIAFFAIFLIAGQRSMQRSQR